MATQEEYQKDNLKKDIEILQEKNEKLASDNKKLEDENSNLKITLNHLKDIKRKSSILIGTFILLSIIMIGLSFFSKEIGSYVTETTIRPNELNTSLSIIETTLVKSIDKKSYLRDSTPIFYGILFFLFLIVLILFFEYKKYEALKDE